MQIRQGRIRTLVVDDSPQVTRTICAVLFKHRGIEIVGTAENGREALAFVETKHPDLVLMDIQMPVMGGLEATAHVLRDHPNTRVIMVTVHDSPELRETCRRCGASGFVVKANLYQELSNSIGEIFCLDEHN